MPAYRLGSAPMISAPGMIAFLMNGYKFPKDRRSLRRSFLAGWPEVPPSVAHRLLKGDIPHTIEGDTVSFEGEDDGSDPDDEKTPLKPHHVATLRRLAAVMADAEQNGLIDLMCEWVDEHATIDGFAELVQELEEANP